MVRSSLLTAVLVATSIATIPPALAQSVSSSSSLAPSLTISITDGRDHIAPGGDSVYVITLSQNTVGSQTTNVQMTLPDYVNIASPSNGGSVNGTTVTWQGVTVSQSQATILSVNTSFLNTAPENTVLTATATAGSAKATDTTVVQSGVAAAGQYTVTLTDGRTTAAPGDTLNYVLKVKNTSAYGQTTDVSAQASQLTSIDTSTPQAEESYPTLLWRAQSFAAGQEKEFDFSTTINKRSNGYTAIRTSAKAGSVSAFDTTTVGSPSSHSSSSSRSSSSSHSSRSSSAQRVLFRNTSDAAEVVPGGRMRFLLYVQNTGNDPVHDATVRVRFDLSQLKFVMANDGGSQQGDSSIVWTIPTLAPGAVWRSTYVLVSMNGAHNGDQLGVIATISGTDISTASLTDIVTISNSDVIATLPQTGAPLDVFSLMSLSLLAGVCAVVQRRVA